MRAALVIWNDVSAELEQEFVAWLLDEHMQERMAIPGFLRGRLFRSNDGRSQAFLTVYDLRDVSTLESHEYIYRSRFPTPRTQILMPQLTNRERRLFVFTQFNRMATGEALIAIKGSDGRQPDGQSPPSSAQIVARSTLKEPESGEVLELIDVSNVHTIGPPLNRGRLYRPLGVCQ